MCFSVTASFTASLALLVCGAAALKRAHEKKLRMIAAIPLLFAAQQGAEGFVWLSFVSPQFASIRLLSAYIFLAFAMIVWPLWIPIAIARFEDLRTYKRYIPSLLAGGICALAFILYALFYPISVMLNHHIVYNVDAYTHFGAWSLYINITLSLLYVIATIVPFFIARNKILWLLGALGACSYVVSYIAYYEAFTSVWCFFAAIISLIVYWFVGNHKKG
jgi:hypothetical protein